ncbi:MAG TPA: ABC-2 family transporter protein [Candidatus Limnocylindrales bacterium]
MRPYRSLFLMSLRRMLTYRLNALIGWLGGAAILISSLAVWNALLRNGDIGGYDWETMKGYLLIAWAMSAVGTSYGDWHMANRIRDGAVATDLTKPVDYQSARFAEQLGGLAFELVAIVVAALAVIVFTGGIPAPAGLGQGLLFALSFAMVVPLKFIIWYITTMVCFWTQNYLGVAWARDAVVWVFSGGLIPLSLMPSWLGSLAAALPFAGLAATPAALYLGQASGTEAWKLLAVQAFWLITLWLGARLLWRGALRALTVHGG